MAVDEYTVVMNNGRRSLPEDILKVDGYSFDSLESAALPGGGIKPRDNEPALTSRYIIRIWRQGENKAGRNFAIHRYEDGSGQLHLQAGDSGNATSSMRKRHNGAGVKVSFKHENVAFQPSSADRSSTTTALAQKWQELAESGVGEMFGFAVHSL